MSEKQRPELYGNPAFPRKRRSDEVPDGYRRTEHGGLVKINSEDDVWEKIMRNAGRGAD